MKKIFSLALILVMSMVVLTGCGNNQQGKTDKKIIVGLDDNFPPMGFIGDNNEIIGFDIDLAKEASKRLGREVEFRPIDWSSKEVELSSGRIDILWNGLDITEKRKENILFSDPYMDSKQLIFVNPNSPIKAVADLAGKKVGVQEGSTADETLATDEALKKSIKEVKKYPDCISALMDLEAGRVDAIVTDEIIGRYYMSKNKESFVVLEEPVGPVGTFGIGFRKDDQKLRDDVQKVINEMKKDGTASKISMKWFNKDIIKYNLFNCFDIVWRKAESNRQSFQ